MGFSGEILSDKGHYEEFVCAICVQVVDLEESILTTCSHVFCWACLREWLLRKKSCPTCQNDLSLVSSSSLPYLKNGSPLAWRVLSRIRIRCPLAKSTKCVWEGDYSELQNHLVSSSEHQSQTPMTLRETALALKEQANEKYASRNFKDAAKLYTKAISMCDDIPAIYGNRAAVFMALGNLDLAIADCEKAVELDTNFSKGYVRGAKAMITAGKFEEAEAFISQCTINGDESVEEMKGKCKHLNKIFQIAKQAIESKQYMKARDATTQLLMQSSTGPVLLMAARAEAEVGSCERARKLALQALRANGGNDPGALVVRALANLYSGQVDEAMKYVKEALRLAPDDKGAMACFKRVRNLRGGLINGREAAEAKDYARAYQCFTELLGDCDGETIELPSRAIVRAAILAERGNTSFRLQRYEEALKDCAAAIYLQEDNQRAWLTKVYVLHAMERHEDALKDLEGLMAQWGQNDALIKGAYEKAQFEVRKSKRPDYYKILSPEAEGESRRLSSLSSEVEIKAAYKQQAMVFHPDKLPAKATAEERAAAEANFKLLGEALEILGDSFKRKLYDQGYDKTAIEERVRRASEARSGNGHGGHRDHHYH